jgi:hypothetical protein
MDEDMKLQIIRLQLEGIVKYWWDTHLESYSLVIEIGHPIYTLHVHIISWDGFFHALRDYFYPTGYH